jgi:hypothetical protein
MAISNEVVRGGVEIEERSRRKVTKSACPLFRLRAGARAISMVAAARAGVDHFWLTGARDEGESGIRSIRRYPQACVEGANVRASHNLDAAQNFNQRSLDFPEPDPTAHILPKATVRLKSCNFDPNLNVYMVPRQLASW